MPDRAATVIPEVGDAVTAAPLAISTPTPAPQSPSVPPSIPGPSGVQKPLSLGPGCSINPVRGLTPSMLGTSSQLLLRTSGEDMSGLNPSAPPFVSNNVANVKQTKNNGRGSKNKAAPDLALEYAQYTANVSKAKIREQEITIKDLRFKNEILVARVVELEKKQKEDIYNKYFPLPGSAPTPQPSGTHHEQGHGHVGCNHGAPHLILSCGNMKNNCFQHLNSTCQSSDTVTGEQTKKFAELKSAIDTIRYKVDLLSEVTIPQLKRTGYQNTPHQPSPVIGTEPPPAPPLSDAQGPPSQPQSGLDPAPPPSPPDFGAPPTLSSHAHLEKTDLMNISQMTIDDAILDVSPDLN